LPEPDFALTRAFLEIACCPTAAASADELSQPSGKQVRFAQIRSPSFGHFLKGKKPVAAVR